MAGVLGQFSNGPIQFNNETGGIEQRGTIDRPQPSATQTTPVTSPAPNGGGSTPTDGIGPGDQDFRNSVTSRPDAVSGIPQRGGGFTDLPFESGGSYGMGGSGFPAGISGGFGSSPGFDDGGEVDTDEADGTNQQQGAASATINPSSMFQSALKFGRSKYGLPTNFDTGKNDDDQGQQTQGFDDGGDVEGMIPDGGQQGGDVTATATSGSGMADPRKALAYLAGDGAVSPDIANALEQHVDPHGQMDPHARTTAAVQSAPNDEARFGMLQHYRTMFNGFSAGARAALDKGDMMTAIKHANEAMTKVPGQKVQFAPAGNGKIAVMSQKGAQPQQAQQSFDNGGDVKDDEPTGWDAVEPSENVEDRRGEAPYGVVDGVIKPAVREWLQNTKENVQSLTGSGKPAATKLGKEAGFESFDAGGEVDDQNDGVIPTANQQGDSTEKVLEDHAATDNDQATAQPSVISPEQFKALLTAGYDKAVDGGLESLMSASAAPSAQSPNPLAAAAGINDIGSAPQPQGVQGPQAQPASNPPGTPSGGSGDPVLDAALGKNWAGTPTGPGAAQPRPATGGPNASAAPKPTDPMAEREQAAIARAQRVAQQIFPWASQGDQRAAYVQHAMQAFADTQGKIDIQQQGGRQQLAMQREANRVQIERDKEAGRNARATDAHTNRWNIAQLNSATRTWTANQQEIGREFGRIMSNNPALARDPQKAWQTAQQMAQRGGVDPMALYQYGLNQSSPQQAAPPQQQQAPAQPKPSIVVFPSGPYAGKPMIKLPDGSYRLAPAQ